MTPDRSDRLQEITDRVFEAVALDCDPQHWVGCGQRPNQLSAKDRGDAVWCRKQAMSTLMLYERLSALLSGQCAELPPSEEDLQDALIDRYEKKARELLEAARVTPPASGRK